MSYFRYFLYFIVDFWSFWGKGYTWLHFFLLCFNFWVWEWFWDCRAIARNDGVFWGYYWLHFFLLCFNFWVCGGFEIATLSLAMTGFFEVTLGCIFYFVLIFGFGWFWDCHAIARNDGFFLGYRWLLIIWFFIDVLLLRSFLFFVLLWMKVFLATFGGYIRCLILVIFLYSLLFLGVFGGKVTLGCIFYFVVVLRWLECTQKLGYKFNKQI